MNKQNYKFANSSNPRDNEEEFFSFPSKSHFRVNLRPGLVFVYFPQCIWELGRYRGSTEKGMLCFVLWHFNFETCRWPVLFYQATWGAGHIFEGVCFRIRVLNKRSKKSSASIYMLISRSCNMFLIANTFCNILSWRIPWTLEPGRLHGATKSSTGLSG